MTAPDDSIRLDDVKDFYEHERKLIRTIWGALQRSYAGEKNMADPAVQQRFSNEATAVFAENGFEAYVPEFVPDCSDDPNDWNLYLKPVLTVNGRIDKLKEFDHDLQKHEVREGVFDGVKGVIDPNTGLMREDAKKKIII